MTQDNAVAMDTVVELTDTVVSAKLRGVAQYTAYLKILNDSLIRWEINFFFQDFYCSYYFVACMLVPPLTFIYAVDVLLFCEGSGQTLQQQKGFIVTLD